MNNNTLRSKGLRLGGLFLLAGTALSSVGCEIKPNLFYTVKAGNLEVTFCNRGASIYSIKLGDTFLTYHPKDHDTFLTSGYCYGRTLGRITGRMKDGKLTVDDKEYQLEINEKNEVTSKNNSIHGGTNGLPSKDFSRHVSENENAISVSFNYFSPSMEAGYPESLDTWVTYTVYKKEARLDTNIYATSSGKTPVNITTHPFFRLANDGDIKDCILEIPADEMAEFEVNKNKKTNQVVIGTQSVKEAANMAFDFTAPKAIGKDLQAVVDMNDGCGGYDHIWKFNEGKNYINLTNPNSKITMHVGTDADAIIMYANCFPHENDEMNPSGKDKLFSGISVEPYKFFTSEQKSIDQLMIEPGKPFTRNISYTFSTIK